MKKKKIFIIVFVCLAVVAVVGTVFGVKAYNEHITQQQIEERIKSIEDVYADFTNETDRGKKLEILSGFIKNNISSNDEISVEVKNSVEIKYSEAIEKMQKYFTDDYDKTIKDNSISNDSLNKMNDREQIQGCIDKLNSLLATIKTEKTAVFNANSKSTADSYVKKADELIKSYSDRITAIEEEEKAEAEKKAAEEKKEQDESSQSPNNNINNDKADAEDDYSSDGSNSYDGTDNGNSYSSNDDNNYYEGNDDSYNDYSDGNSYEGDSNSSGSSSGSNDYYEWWGWTDGETGKTTYHDSNGNHWDDDGNYYHGDGNGWYHP